MEDELIIAGQRLRSRLILGTGKHRTMEEMVAAMEAADVEMITVALRRIDFDDPSKKTILDYFDWSHYRILPNTAGCQTAEEAMPGRAIGPRDGALQLDQARGHPRSEIPAPGSDRHTGSGASARR